MNFGHQVLYGAANNGRNSVAVGRVASTAITVYASGQTIIILSENFNLLQKISLEENITALACCSQSGQICVSQGRRLLFFDVSHHGPHNAKTADITWQLSQQVECRCTVLAMDFSKDGKLLATAGECIQLWQCMDGIHSPIYSPWSPSSSTPTFPFCSSTPLSPSTNTPVSPSSNTLSSQQKNTPVPASSTSSSTPVSASLSPLLLCPEVEFVLGLSDEEVVEESSRHQSQWSSVGSIQPASTIHIIAFSSDGELFATAGENTNSVHIWRTYFSISDTDWSVTSPTEQRTCYHTTINHPSVIVALSWCHPGDYRRSSNHYLMTSCRDHVCRMWTETFPRYKQFVVDRGQSTHSNQTETLKRKKSRLRNSLQRLRSVLGTRDKYSMQAKLPVDTVVHTRDTSTSDESREQDSFSFHLEASINPLLDSNRTQDAEILNSNLRSDEVSKYFIFYWMNSGTDLHLDANMQERSASRLSNGVVDDKPNFSRAYSSGPELTRLLTNGASSVGEDENTKSSKLWRTLSSHITNRSNRKSELVVNGNDGSYRNSASSVSLVSNGHSNFSSLNNSQTPGIIFTVHPLDGCLMIWTVNWLDRRVKVTYMKCTESAMPASDARTLASLYYHDTNNDQQGDNGHSGHNGDKGDNGSDVRIVSRHFNGSLCQWKLLFDDNLMKRFEHQSRSTGHRTRITAAVSHPELPLLITTGHQQQPPCSELVLWRVSDKLEEIGRLTSIESDFYTDVLWISSLASRSSVSFMAFSKDSPHVYTVNIDGHHNSLKQENEATVRSFKYGHIDDLGSVDEITKKQFNIKLAITFPGHLFVDELGMNSSNDPNCFYLVILDDNKSRFTIHTWSISVVPCQGVIETNVDVSDIVKKSVQPRITCNKMCADTVLLPGDLCLSSSCVAAGHCSAAVFDSLSAAPYLLTITHSDQSVHFWTCRLTRNGRSCVWSECSRCINNNAPITVPGCIFDIKNAYSGRLAVLYCALEDNKQQEELQADYSLGIYECESTGGTDWIMEDVIDTQVRTDDSVHMHWLSSGDTKHILTVLTEKTLFVYSPTVDTQPAMDKCQWKLIRQCSLFDKSPRQCLMTSLTTWVQNSYLVYCSGNELDVSSQWSVEPSQEEVAASVDLSIQLSVESDLQEATVDAEEKRVTMIKLLQQANQLRPSLPQYHPTQLFQLLQYGKMKRVAAILLHLIKCLETNDKRANEETSLEIMNDCAEMETPDNCVAVEFIAPLPLHTLLNVENQTTRATSDHSDHNFHSDYGDLFNGETNNIDDDQLSLNNNNQPSISSSDHFGPCESEILMQYLTHVQLPGLTRIDQMHLMAVTDCVTGVALDTDSTGVDVKTVKSTVDDCGMRFLLSAQHYIHLLKTRKLQQNGLSTACYCWAFHSEYQQDLLNSLRNTMGCELTWNILKQFGAGWWIKQTSLLKKCIEELAKSEFKATGNPLECSIFFLALKKKNVISGLYRSIGDTKMTNFFKNNFSEDRWRRAAMKNAFSLLGRQRYLHAATFFLLADSLNDALDVIINKLEDPQLAYVICRLWENDSSRTHHMLEKLCDVGDMFIRCMVHWTLGDHVTAKNVLLHSVNQSRSENIVDVANLYSYLRCHPLITRFPVNSDVTLLERQLYFFTAYKHLQQGCPLLALEALLLLPQHSDGNSKNSDLGGLVSNSRLENNDSLPPTVKKVYERKCDVFTNQMERAYLFQLIVTDLSAEFREDTVDVKTRLYSWLEKQVLWPFVGSGDNDCESGDIVTSSMSREHLAGRRQINNRIMGSLLTYSLLHSSEHSRLTSVCDELSVLLSDNHSEKSAAI